ncbi:hypothetical protein Syun_020741 [Stephania yunnanensis]|uniref:Uncharacterized protein n=1 Tax=Stephania yunnanensis TaxID=152371 RepID=A0AAP0IED8_9MAGN
MFLPFFGGFPSSEANIVGECRLDYLYGELCRGSRARAHEVLWRLHSCTSCGHGTDFHS